MATAEVVAPAPEALLPDLIDLVEAAGRAILEIYHAGSEQVALKADRSPVTTADLASHRLLVAGLAQLTPGIPVLSEESRSIPWEERRGWSRHWLVDPLDGTKEFLHRNGEFTVNVALIDHGRPVLGVVGVPVRAELYVGSPTGAFLHQSEGEVRQLRAGGYDAAQRLRVAVSRSHPSAAVEELLARLGDPERIAVGSSLKLCLVARGDVDLYPRLGPIMEWDIAAAHAVVEAAGGFVRSVDDQLIRYGSEDLYAPWFIARRAGVDLD